MKLDEFYKEINQGYELYTRDIVRPGATWSVEAMVKAIGYNALKGLYHAKLGHKALQAVHYDHADEIIREVEASIQSFAKEGATDA